MLSKPFVEELIEFVKEEQPQKPALTQHKKALAKKHGLKVIPSDIAIMTSLSQEERLFMKSFLQTKPVRTGSGVTVVAVMTKPMRCPHGKCTYCPGGPGSAFGDVPQSYTGHEPASMRGARADYDAYVQVFTRLEQYVVSGHNPEKVELILMGGTFTSYPQEYQDEVIADVYSAMNDFSTLFYNDKGEFLFEDFKEFFELPGSIHDKERTDKVYKKAFLLKDKSNRDITSAQKINEQARIRCIGLTIETRPSHAKKEHALLMLEQGCTRVELGVQTTFDEVLTKVHRDHTLQDSIDSIADLRDLGFKLNFHMMLGLPLMNPARDKEAITRIFSDPAFRPDMVKIYPCMVMEGTPLYYEYQQGTYEPYSTALAASLIAEWAPLFPEWVRVMRVQRDIPTKMTKAGVDRTNLRQYVDQEMDKTKSVFRDIRAREINKRPINDYELRVTEYDASGGKEFFIQVVEKNCDGLIGFCRLRFPSRTLHPAVTPTSAIIRELHVYGKAVGVGKPGEQQHKGFGKQLMERAEAICKEYGKDKLLVISGVGVREYYKRLGYEQAGPYVAKNI